MPVYAAHLREIIKKGVDHPDHPDQPLKGFKIVVDAGNGSGGFLASDVLAPLGADTSGRQQPNQLECSQGTYQRKGEERCSTGSDSSASGLMGLNAGVCCR